MTPPPAATGAVEPPGSAARGPRTLRRPLAGRLADRGYLALAGASALAAVALVAYLIAKTAQQTGPVWDTFGVLGFLTGTEWIVSPAQGDPVFGALPFIYGTVATSAIAMLIAVPLAVGIALATTVFLPRRTRGPVASLIDLLAAVPSVVFGFWGIVVLVPWANPGLEWIAEHNLRFLAIVTVLLAAAALASSGAALRGVLGGAAGLLAAVIALTLAGVLDAPFGLLEGPVLSGSYVLAGLVLAVMVLPIITAITREVLATVPRDQQEAALALGATRWEMVQHSMLPWARSGIVGASALGLGRAMGETIALALVLGNVPNIFGSLVGPGSTAAGVIALETGEAGDLQLAALTALAIILFVLTMVVNGIARLLVRRGAAGPGLLTRVMARRATGESVTGAAPMPEPEDTPAARPAVTVRVAEVSRERRIRSRVSEIMVFGAVALGVVPLAFVLGKIFISGIGLISWDFLTEVQPTDPNDVAGYGIGNALVGTLILTGIATALAAPLGILTSLFMSELAAMGGRPRRVADGIGFFVDVLLGMPSIVAGLTVYLAIVIPTQQFSALAGGIALAIVMFPIVVRSSDEVLRLVPHGLKEAALALGAPRWRTAWSVVLPAAIPGILTGVVLAIARASGETAPLLFTSLGLQTYSTALLEPISALPQLIFTFTVQVRTDESVEFAWAATFVLVTFILMLNLIARLTARLANSRETR